MEWNSFINLNRGKDQGFGFCHGVAPPRWMCWRQVVASSLNISFSVSRDIKPAGIVGSFRESPPG
jgi:hypothetical protein